ncbi:MAG: hypothetical protein ACXACR_15740, partial [Candidatus Hodarchaeales archaeon]
LKKKYEFIQNEFLVNFGYNYKFYGRFHALIVCHGQNYCQKNDPKCQSCFLLNSCTFGRHHKDNSQIADIQIAISNPSKKKKVKRN